MLEKFLNIFRIPDLRKRVLFTLGILAVYRLGAYIPTPGVNTHQLELLFNAQSGSALGLMDLFGGGNLRRMTIFALGIMPYITASIIFQLLTVVYEPLARIQKEGELGRRKITQWTRYMTVILGALQSIGIAAILTKQGLVLNPGIGFSLMTVLTLTTGTAFIMWLGEQITDRGIGNGMSLLIFAGIVAGLPRGVADLVQKVQTNAWGSFTIFAVLLLVVGMVAVVAFIVFVERSERRIPIQSARRIVGRRMMGGAVEPSAPEGELGRRHAGHLCQLHSVGAAAVRPDGVGAEQPLLPADHAGAAARLSVVRNAVHAGHYLLCLLLRIDRHEAGRHCRQLPQVGIVHSRNPARQAHLGLHQRHPYPHHAGRRALPDHHFPGAHLPDFGHPFRQDLAHRQVL